MATDPPHSFAPRPATTPASPAPAPPPPADPARSASGTHAPPAPGSPGGSPSLPPPAPGSLGGSPSLPPPAPAPPAPPAATAGARPAQKPGLFGRVRQALSPRRILSDVLREQGPGAAGEILQRARREADSLMSEKIVEAQRTANQFADQKIADIKREILTLIEMVERKLDERIEKEIAWKLRGLKWTLAVLVLMTLISLAYQFLKQRYFAGG